MIGSEGPSSMVATASFEVTNGSYRDPTASSDVVVLSSEAIVGSFEVVMGSFEVAVASSEAIERPYDE